MANRKQKLKKNAGSRSVNIEDTKFYADKINALILLCYGFVTVFTPNLQTLNSNGPKFFAFSILNLLTYCYLIYRERKVNSYFIFSQLLTSRIGLAYTLLLLISLLSFFKSINVIESIVVFSKIFTTFTATWIISMILINDKRSVKYLAIGLAGLLIYDSTRVFYEIYQYIQGDLESIKLIKAGYSNKNILAAALFIKLPFALWLISFEKDWWNKLGMLSLFLGFLAVLFMSSRAFYLGLIFLSISYTAYLAVRYFQLNDKTLIKTGAVYLSCLIFSLLVFSIVQHNFYPEDKTIYNRSVAERLATINTASNKAARLQIWGLSFEIIKDNPVLGVGLGNWKVVILEQENKLKSTFIYYNKAHNDFIEITAESGLFAGILFILIFAFTFYAFIGAVFKIKSEEAIKLLFLPAFGLLAYLFDAFFNFPQDRPQIQALFAIYVGMAIAFSPQILNNKIVSKDTILSVNKKFVWLVPAFAVLLIASTAYVLFLNFQSLKIQRVYKEEEVSGRSNSNSTFLINHYTSVPNLSSSGVPLYLQIAKKLIDEKQFRKAVNLLQSDNPSPYDSRREMFLANSYFELNQLDSALIYIEQAHQQKPLYFEYVELYCGILESLEREKEIIPLLDTFLINKTNERRAWLFMGAYMYRYDDKQNAIQIMDSAFNLFPNDTAIAKQRNFYSAKYYMPYYQKAIDQYNNENYSEAARLFKISEADFVKLGGHQRFPKFLEMWALSYLKLNEYKKGKALLQRILVSDPMHYPSLMNLGTMAYHIENDDDAAIKYFNQCLKTKDPEYYILYEKIGSLYSMQKKYDLAIENYENALRYGSSKELINNLYLLWKSKGNTEKTAHYKDILDNYGQKRKARF